jgi:hypothetical protein
MAYSIPTLIADKKDHKTFNDLCFKHHIEGLLFSFYDEFKAQGEFKAAWIKNWHRNQLSQNKILEVIDTDCLNFPPVLLKGAALLGLIYEDIGARFMSDIDLLIHHDDFTLVEQMLTTAGFSKIKSNKWKANNFKSEWSLVVDGTELCIELHSKLYYHVDNSYEFFELEDSHIEGFKRLSLIDQFLHLCAHYGFQHTFQKVYWGFDLYFFGVKFKGSLDIDLLIARSKKLKILKSLRMCLGVLDNHFGLTLSLNKDDLVTADFLWSEERRSFEYFKVKHLTKDSIFQALEYDLLHFFSRF